MLGAARRAQEWGSMLREDRWGRWVAVELLGTDITGKRLGILGMGRIGRAVAQRARGFEMEIHYHNRNRLPTELEAGATYHATAEDMLPLCDFLSINCPATDENHHFINRERIACLPDGAIVVNSARGTIVEDDALIAALRSGKIAGIGLDVYEGEPNIDPRYRDIDTAFLMPHIGSATIETRDAMGFRALDNLDAVFAGETPRDRIA
jgi:glyoxylate reductase